MITTHTVFILGAGASEPYGFPVGARLKESVVLKLQKGARGQLVKAGADPGEAGSFMADLSECGDASIDAFLENRKDLVTVGKMAIAQALIPAERMDRLFMLDLLDHKLHRSERRVRDDRFERNWYPYLWKKMRTTFDRLGENKVSFITFNYDRSLEQFLYTVIRKNYKIEHPTGEYAQAVAHFPIIHVHGSLGRLPWQDGDGEPRDYVPTVTLEAIRQAAASIQIVSETDANTPQFEKARTLIKKAERVVFLGFGYHEENLRKLNMPQIFRSGRRARTIMGSAYGFLSGELKPVSESTGMRVRNLGEPGDDALLFLRRNADKVF